MQSACKTEASDVTRNASTVVRFILEETRARKTFVQRSLRTVEKRVGEGLGLYLDVHSFVEFCLGAVDAEQLNL